MNKSVFAATAVALVLSLIGLFYVVAIAPKSCGSDHCVKVWIQTDNGVPTIHVDVRELYVHGRDQVIFWNLDNTDAQSYKFPDNGIAFMAGDSGTTQFDCRKQNDTKFKCKDSGDRLGQYKYTVTVAGTPQPGPLPPNPLDPWIYNE
jgi:hypothetical protein